MHQGARGERWMTSVTPLCYTPEGYAAGPHNWVPLDERPTHLPGAPQIEVHICDFCLLIITRNPLHQPRTPNGYEAAYFWFGVYVIDEVDYP